MNPDLSELPLDWRMNRVRHVCDVAESYGRRSQRAWYWLRLRTSLRRRLEKEGHPSEKIAELIARFREAVREERQLRDLVDGVQLVDRRGQRPAAEGRTKGKAGASGASTPADGGGR